eukprot:g6538.t1
MEWVSYLDSDGTPFFYNKTTNTSVWEKPKALIEFEKNSLLSPERTTMVDIKKGPAKSTHHTKQNGEERKDNDGNVTITPFITKTGGKKLRACFPIDSSLKTLTLGKEVLGTLRKGLGNKVKQDPTSFEKALQCGIKQAMTIQSQPSPLECNSTTIVGTRDLMQASRARKGHSKKQLQLLQHLKDQRAEQDKAIKNGKEANHKSPRKIEPDKPLRPIERTTVLQVERTVIMTAPEPLPPPFSSTATQTFDTSSSKTDCATQSEVRSDDKGIQTESTELDPLSTLLQIAKDNSICIDIGSRKLHLKQQSGEVVVRTGGGYLRWDEFISRYGTGLIRGAKGNERERK